MGTDTVFTSDLTFDDWKGEIEKVYKLFPRKMGKSGGMRTLWRQAKSPAKLKQLEVAISNYCAYLKKDKIEPRYVMHWSTFANQWKDWLDPNQGSNSHSLLDLSEVGFER